MGIVSNVQDWSQYLAWLRWFEHSAVIINPLTPEQQQPLFFNAQWWLLAKVVQLTGATPDVLIQGFRVVCAIGFVLATFDLCARYFPQDRLARWTAFLTVQLISGFGWVLVVLKQLTGAKDVPFPLAVYVAEPISFQNMVIYPHLLLATALIVLIFRFFAEALANASLKAALIAGFISLALGLSHTYDLLIVYAVLGVAGFFYAWQTARWRPFVIAYGLLLAISAAPPAYFFLLTKGDPIWSVVLRQYKDAGVFTPDPLLLLVLLGMPLLLAWAALAVRAESATETPPVWRVLVRSWFVVNFFLNYIPTDFQIKMLTGWQIPIAFLAVELLLFTLPKLLPARLAAHPRLRTVLAALLVLLILPHNAYLLLWRVLEVRRLEHAHFLYRDDLAAMRWLHENTQPNDVVLAGLTVGQYMPGLAGNQPYVAHWAQTVNFVQRRAAVGAFFDAATPDARRLDTLSAVCARYVWHGREERALGSFNPAVAPYLSKVWSNASVDLYRTDVCK